jgi:hypothetical protein
MGNITMKKILIASLVATAFVPVTFATPAFAEDPDLSLCTSNNRNIEFDAVTYQGDEVTEFGDAARSGQSQNVFVKVTVRSGPVLQDCNATNTRSGNPVPGQSSTGIVLDPGGEIIDEYEVKVCQNVGQTGTAVTSEGTAMGYSQAQCETLTA